MFRGGGEHTEFLCADAQPVLFITILITFCNQWNVLLQVVVIHLLVSMCDIHLLAGSKVRIVSLILELSHWVNK